MIFATWFRTLTLAAGLAVQAGLALATPQVGWWWNPNESGRGYFIESQNGVFFMGAYFYADDGRARWLVAGGDNGDPYNYSGRLLEVSNGQTLYGSYVAPAAPVDAGAVTVSFSDDTHGTIVWPGGAIPIVREIFDTGVASFQPESGWWWNPNESGSGYSIEVEGGTLFMVGFMYDDAGNPIWYLSAGAMSTPTAYHGNLVQVAGGQTESGPYHPPSTVTTIGTVDINFTAVDAGTLAFSDTTGMVAQQLYPQAGGSRSVSIQRQFRAATTKFPARYSGNFSQYDAEVLDPTATGGKLTIQTKIYGTLTWAQNSAPACTTPSGLKCQTYTVASGSFDLHVDYSQSEPKAAGESCAGLLDELGIAFNAVSLTHLFVYEDGTYELVFGAPQFSRSMKLQCHNDLGQFYPQPWTYNKYIEMPYPPPEHGSLTGGLIKGFMPITGVSSILVRSGDWIFGPQ